MSVIAMTEDFDLRCHVGDPPDLSGGQELGYKAGGPKPTIELSNHVLDGAPTPPAAVHRSNLNFKSWGMLGNANYGSCVIAMMLHSIQAFHLDAGLPAPIWTEEDWEYLYHEIGGWVKGDPSTDQGCDEGVAMQTWEHPGLKTHDGTHTIAGTASFRVNNVEETKRMIWEFISPQMGYALPQTAQGQTEWHITDHSLQGPAAPGSWGGHGVPLWSYDPYRVRLGTWGGELLETWPFHLAYAMEGRVVITHEMLNRKGVSPTGVNWTTLGEELHAVMGA